MTEEPQLPEMEQTEDERTALGFGGKTVDGILQRGDVLYLVLKCEISSIGEKEETKGDTTIVRHSAGARTTILAEITEAEAAQYMIDS